MSLYSYKLVSYWKQRARGARPITFCRLLLASNNRKEHVEGNLDRVDENQTVLGGNELEVDGVHNGPDLPRSLTSRKKIFLDFIDNHRKRVTVDQTQVGEENSHKDGTPEQLVHTDLKGDMLGFSSFNLPVQPVVEVVSRRTVIDEPEDSERDESLHIERSATDEKL